MARVIWGGEFVGEGGAESAQGLLRLPPIRYALSNSRKARPQDNVVSS